MSLTTPDVHHFDLSLPVPNWFLYWKTSPSLWEEKLRKSHIKRPLIIPIYWGLHNELRNVYDFGDKRPETDLLKLCGILKKLQIQAIFMIPIGPAPYLPAGGVPSFACEYQSYNREGLGVVVKDIHDKLNQLYSFYDPKVFEAFNAFAAKLGSYFSLEGVDFPVWGGNHFYLSHSELHHCIEDRSRIFERSFGRYLQSLKRTLHEEPSHQLESNYATMVRNLYIESLKESMSGHYHQEVNFCEIVSSPKDLMNYIFNQSRDKEEFRQLFKILNYQCIPTTHMIPSGSKKALIDHAITQAYSGEALSEIFELEAYQDEEIYKYRPLTFFELLGREANEGQWSGLGLLSYLKKNFYSTFKLCDSDSAIQRSQNDEDEQKVFILKGEGLSKKEILKILSLFTHGKKLIIDSSSLDKESLQRLQQFLDENGLRPESVHFHFKVEKYSLGTGRLILFDFKKFYEISESKRDHFWPELFKTFRLDHLNVPLGEGVYGLWSQRGASSFELDFEQVRRITLYNPGPKTVNVRFPHIRNLVFMKSVDAHNSTVKNGISTLEVELGPMSRVSIDYGFFEL